MLASTSRNALKTAQTLAGAAAERSSPLQIALSKCAQQQRSASTAEVRIRQQLFRDRDGQQRPRRDGLRNGPWQFTHDYEFRGTTVMSKATRHNLNLARVVERNSFVAAMTICKQMKTEGVTPDLTTYNYIIRACADSGCYYGEARAVFEDMIAMGINPDRQIFHHLLHAARFLDTKNLWEILDLMRSYGLEPNESTYECIITQYAENDNLELALQYLADLGKRGLSPTLKTARSVILAAGAMEHPRLALDLAEAFEQTSVRRLDGDVWTQCLVACSEALFEDGVLRTWQKVVHELAITPDEGCCIQVLHTAGRHGLSELGLDALRVLSRIGVTWEEYHFAPVIEAFCKENKIKEALSMLDLIRSHSIAPVAETAYPIYQAIQADAETVDEAYGFLEALHEEGKNVDVTALNVVIQASVAIGDLQRAVGTYKASESLGVAPNVDSYNLLLSGCIIAQHRDLGNRLLAEMKAASVKPDVRTYERLIVLCLTQAEYEDAFFYLEEMKSEEHLPPISVYEAIIRKCVQVGDVRYKLALDEMYECGYELSAKLNGYIQTGGAYEGTEDELPKPDYSASRKRQDWASGRAEGGREGGRYIPAAVPDYVQRRRQPENK